MSNLLYGRSLFGEAMGFHVIFAFLGVGVPFLVCLFEFLALRTGNKNYRVFARRLSYALVMIFTVGSISGTAVSFMLSTLWPGFMSFMSKVDILPFVLEGFGFFVEVIFLTIYVLTWDRIKEGWRHWWLSVPIVLASAMTSFFITAANAFMHTPAGFTLVNGQPIDLQPIQALFNPSTLPEAAHVLATSYLNSALAVAGLYALYIFLGNREKYFKQILQVTMLVVLVLSLLVGLTGDRQAKFLADHEPIRLAADTATFPTQSHAPELVGGVVTNDGVMHALKIPGLLSFLAHGQFSSTVLGLNSFPQQDWPPLYGHYTFDLMVGLGILYVGYAVLFVLAMWRKWQGIIYSKLNLLILALIGLSSFLAVDAGWETTEAGRQPWIIYHVMQVKDAFTTSPYVMQLYWVLTAVFLGLFIALLSMLIVYFRMHPLSKEEVS